jgi:hypothetical protein
VGQSFTFWRSYIDTAEALPKREQGPFIMGIIRYGLDGAEPAFTGASRAAFIAIRPHLESSLKRAEANRENGKKGGRPKSVKKPNHNPTITQPKPKKTQQNPTITHLPLEREGEDKNLRTGGLTEVESQSIPKMEPVDDERGSTSCLAVEEPGRDTAARPSWGEGAVSAERYVAVLERKRAGEEELRAWVAAGQEGGGRGPA